MKYSYIEKRTFIIFLTASFLNGFITSVTNVQDIIGKKALAGLDWQITLIAMIWPVSNFFSIWWGKALERTHNKSRYFILIAIVGRLSLVLALFVTNIYHFIILLTIMLSFNALQIPAQNALLQSNIRPEIRGKVFGYSSAMATIIGLFGSYFAGRILDVNENWFRYIFVIAGIAGSIGALLLSTIPFKNPKKELNPKPLNTREFFLGPINRTISLLKKNKDFAIYERNFMIYGLGFLILVPIIPKFLVEIMEMNYTNTFLAKGVIAQFGMLIFTPIAGLIHDKKHPNLFVAIVFAMLGFYPITLLISSLIPVYNIAIGFVFLAYFIFGISMGGIIISWNIGSIAFAGEEDASMYQSVHITLTGLRGLVFPPLGLLVLKTLGIQAVFIISIIGYYTASYLSYKQYKRRS